MKLGYILFQITKAHYSLGYLNWPWLMFLIMRPLHFCLFVCLFVYATSETVCLRIISLDFGVTFFLILKRNSV
jgi:hypothetical protein